jgi:hypothetical protein
MCLPFTLPLDLTSGSAFAKDPQYDFIEDMRYAVMSFGWVETGLGLMAFRA